MRIARNSYGRFTRLRLTADPKCSFPLGFCTMADIAYLALALLSFAVLALTVFFCDRL
jgi:hypothetical protein